MVKLLITVNPWESISSCVGKFPAGFYRPGMPQTTTIFLKYMFYCSDRKKLKNVVVGLVTFTNNSTNFPFVCVQCISNSSLTLTLVQLMQQIHLSSLFFCDPGSLQFLSSTLKSINLYTSCQCPPTTSVYKIGRVERTGTSLYCPFPWNCIWTLSANQR